MRNCVAIVISLRMLASGACGLNRPDSFGLTSSKLAKTA
jgi:hypothetical protein